MSHDASATAADADAHGHSRSLQASPIQGVGHSASTGTLGRREGGPGARRPGAGASGAGSTPVLPQVGSDLVSLENEKRRLAAELASLQAAKAELDGRHAAATKAHEAQKASLGKCVPVTV